MAHRRNMLSPSDTNLISCLADPSTIGVEVEVDSYNQHVMPI